MQILNQTCGYRSFATSSPHPQQPFPATNDQQLCNSSRRAHFPPTPTTTYLWGLIAVVTNTLNLFQSVVYTIPSDLRARNTNEFTVPSHMITLLWLSGRHLVVPKSTSTSWSLKSSLATSLNREHDFRRFSLCAPLTSSVSISPCCLLANHKLISAAQRVPTNEQRSFATIRAGPHLYRITPGAEA